MKKHTQSFGGGLLGALLLSAPLHAQDFNADGFQDLVIGTPGKDTGGLIDSGLLHIAFGGGGGPATGGTLLRHEGMIGGVVDGGERFGHASAWGDFNADGFLDLAVSVPVQTVGGLAGAGGVYVLFGPGLGAGPLLVSVGGPQAGAQFGYALAAADFDNDGFDDLAVGAPYYDTAAMADSGRVDVFYGPGLAGVIATQAVCGNPVEAGDNFGSTLQVGNFNGDPFADLAAGVPGEDLGAALDCARPGRPAYRGRNSSNDA